MDETSADAEASPDTRPPGPLARLTAGMNALDWLAVGLLSAGVVAVATGLLPVGEASGSLERIAPLLAFLGTVIILAELAAKAELFHVIATRVTIAAKGRTFLLFLLCVAFAAGTTIFLNLDTTAVLLTPVMLLTATKAGTPQLPLAMTTVWLANTASLLLPVSNLTNLLAAERIGLSPLAFAGHMALPQVAALIVIGVLLWLFYWRQAPRTYRPPAAHVPADRRLFIAAAVCCVVFAGGVLAGWEIEIVSALSAAGLIAAFSRWGRQHLAWSLVPWRLLIFVTGLFLVVDTVGVLGLLDWISSLVGTDPGAEGVVRAAVGGGVLSNVLNNLPAYVAVEAVLPVGNSEQLFGLLISTNVAPLVTPWASLATLLWAERCRAAGLEIRWGRFMAAGALAAVLVTAAGVGALLIS